VLLGERCQIIDRIVAEGEQRDAALPELLCHLLQLNQLRLAERSPLGATVENHERPLAAASGVEVNHLPRLVGQANVRKALTQLGTDRGEIPRRKGHGRPRVSTQLRFPL